MGTANARRNFDFTTSALVAMSSSDGANEQVLLRVYAHPGGVLLLPPARGLAVCQVARCRSSGWEDTSQDGECGRQTAATIRVHVSPHRDSPYGDRATHRPLSPMAGGGGSCPSERTHKTSSFKQTSTKNLKRNDGGRARRYSHFPPVATE